MPILKIIMAASDMIFFLPKVAKKKKDSSVCYEASEANNQGGR